MRAGKNHGWNRVREGVAGGGNAEGETTIVAAGCHERRFLIETLYCEGFGRALVDGEGFFPYQGLGGRREVKRLLLYGCVEGPEDYMAVGSGREDGCG